MITLHDYELSGNCYKIRLMLGFLGVGYTTRHVDFYPGLEHRSEAFRAINPLAQLPVLDHDGFVIRDAQAILTYLASTFDKGGSWGFGTSPRRDGGIAQWLAFAGELTGSIGAARLHDAFFFELDADAARLRGRELLRILDAHLWFQEREAHGWLASGESPSIADIACFPYVMLSEDADLPREEYPSVRRWLDRFKRIDGFRVMSGIFPTR